LAHLEKHIVLRYKNREVSGKVDKNGGIFGVCGGEGRKFRGLGGGLRHFVHEFMHCVRLVASQLCRNRELHEFLPCGWLLLRNFFGNRELNEFLQASGGAERSEFLTASLFIKPQSGLLIRTIRIIRGLYSVL
jgi:hypothetical protein